MLNFPGTEEYDCKLPGVFKQGVDGMLAAELFIYVDGRQLIRPTETLCWEVSIRWGSTCSWLDIQYASIKFQPLLLGTGLS